VLAVVEHQQQALALQVVAQGRQRPPRRDVLQADGIEDRPGHQQGVADRRERDEPGTVGESAGQVRGGPDREPRLADAPASRQDQEPGGGQQVLDLGQLTAPADEAGQLGRPVARPVPGCPSRHLRLTLHSGTISGEALGAVPYLVVVTR
jgi:hypothetical protein